jgi:hypothetical protein
VRSRSERYPSQPKVESGRGNVQAIGKVRESSRNGVLPGQLHAGCINAETSRGGTERGYKAIRYGQSEGDHRRPNYWV